jgi:hypothetical protein
MQNEVGQGSLRLEIDYMREKLYKAIDQGLNEEVVSISQKLDELILTYTRTKLLPKVN